MSKVMLVNVTHVEESRVAILHDGVLEAYEIETINRTQIKGNIYNAVVENVHPTLEAAFLKISPELKGFLPLDEVNFNLLPARSDSRKAGKIGQHLHNSQKIMAQVVREPFAGKPPTVSTYFSLPGRFLVLMPGVDSAGVSRKIEDPEQRERLRKIVDDLKPPEGFGLIVRTAGMGQTKAELQRDLRYLLRLWQSIQRASKATEFPGLVYSEADLVIRTMRDHLSTDIEEVWIDSQETYDRALEFVRDVMPARAKTLRLYSGSRPLFNKFNLEEQIETIYKRRVPLPSGGEIVIDGTEALTAIDVNSARSKRKGDVEDSILQTNLEASAEIARQLRLRDLAGLIVIDFIDMSPARNRKRVEDAMRDALKSDRARHDATRISKLGLMEVARQRLRGEKMRATYTSCPTCEGYGLIKNLEAAALAALRKLQTRSSRGDIGRVRMSLPTEVATWMLNNKREDLVNVERSQRIRVEVEPSADLLRHDCELETFPREKDETPAARVVGDRQPAPLPPETTEMVTETPEPATETPVAASTGNGETETATPRRRRRRRRRSSADTANDDPSSEAPAEAEAGPVTPPAADTNVVPFSAPVVDPAEVDAEAVPAEGESAGDRVRRRRRRRRGRGRGSGGASDANGEGSADARAESPNESQPDREDAPTESQPESRPDQPVAPRPDAGPTAETVPRHVRSDELVPAASGGRGEGRGSRGRGRAKRSGGRGGGSRERSEED